MNKLLCILLLLTACSSDTVNINKAEYNKLKGVVDKTFTVDGRLYHISTASDGHEYYSVYIATGGYHDFHYPGCVLCNK